jgi:ADP-ribose pyrophosphatase
MPVLYEGHHLRLVEDDGWEHVQRVGITGIVVLVPCTDDGRLVLVEQYRAPVGARVIEWPAGLAGDQVPDEPLQAAAERELLEETGFRARNWRLVAVGPPSAGLSNEVVSVLLATGLERVGPGGGDDDEEIEVHLVPRAEIDDWLEARFRQGVLVDPKVYAGLYFLDARRP